MKKLKIDNIVTVDEVVTFTSEITQIISMPEKEFYEKYAPQSYSKTSSYHPSVRVIDNEMDSFSMSPMYKMMRKEVDEARNVIDPQLKYLRSSGMDVFPGIEYKCESGVYDKETFLGYLYKAMYLGDYLVPDNDREVYRFTMKDIAVIGKILIMDSVGLRPCTEEKIAWLRRYDVRSVGGISRSISISYALRSIENVISKILSCTYEQEDHYIYRTLPMNDLFVTGMAIEETIDNNDFVMIDDKDMVYDSSVVVPGNVALSNEFVLPDDGYTETFVRDFFETIDLDKKSISIEMQNYRVAQPPQAMEFKVARVYEALIQRSNIYNLRVWKMLNKSFYMTVKDRMALTSGFKDLSFEVRTSYSLLLFLRSEKYYFDEKEVDDIVYCLLKCIGTTCNLVELVINNWNNKYDCTLAVLFFSLVLMILSPARRDYMVYSKRLKAKWQQLPWRLKRSMGCLLLYDQYNIGTYRYKKDEKFGVTIDEPLRLMDSDRRNELHELGIMVIFERNSFYSYKVPIRTQ